MTTRHLSRLIIGITILALTAALLLKQRDDLVEPFDGLLLDVLHGLVGLERREFLLRLRHVRVDIAERVFHPAVGRLLVDAVERRR